MIIGPLDLLAAKAMSRYTPATYGYTPYGHGGAAYKIGVAVTMGSAATVTIAPPARGHVVIDQGLTSVTYRSCARQPGGFWAQYFAFTHPPIRGCVPLDVTIGNQPPVHHITLSLFAGTCAQ